MQNGLDLNKFVQSMAQTALESARAMAASLRPTQEQLEEFGRNLNRVVLSAGAEIARGLAQAVETFHNALPENWHELTGPEIFDAIEFMENTGWSLVWTPPAAEIAAILAASSDPDREAILLASEARILADLDPLLDDVQILLTAGEAAREVIETYRSGHFRSAQALAATTLTALLTDDMNLRTLARAKQALAKYDVMKGSVHEIRLYALLGAAKKTLDSWQPGIDPVPSGINRHASAHTLDSVQYRQVNSLAATMLVTTLTYELDVAARLQARATP